MFARRTLPTECAPPGGIIGEVAGEQPDSVHSRARGNPAFLYGLPIGPGSPRSRGRTALRPQRLAADVGRLGDLDQHADALVGAQVLLLALGELGEDRLAHRAALVQRGGAEEAQEARLHLAVALRLHVHVHDADAAVAPEAVEDRAARALEIGEVLVVEHDHRALRPHYRPVRPVDGEDERIAVLPGGGDE